MNPAVFGRIESVLVIGMSLLAIAGACYLFAVGRYYPDGLAFLFSAAILLLIRKVKTIAFGNTSVELEHKVTELESQVGHLEKKTDQTNESASVALNASIYGIAKRPAVESSAVSVAQADGPDPNDPQKGRWGGQPISNNRRLAATIEPVSFNSDLCRVSLKVVSTNRNKPLAGNVVFHLHHTFPNPDVLVEVKEGEAGLDVVAWGAFTVGAEADAGLTRLELNLGHVPGGSESFYRN